jgi:hypothetical protein
MRCRIFSTLGHFGGPALGDQPKRADLAAGTAYASPPNIVFPRLRALLSVVAMVALLAPVATSVCAQPSARHCQGAAHDCCKVPRLTQCDCGGAHSSVFAEPAQRAKNVSADTTFVALSADRVALVSVSPRIENLHPVAPPPGTGERLSLLAVLIV